MKLQMVKFAFLTLVGSFSNFEVVPSTKHAIRKSISSYTVANMISTHKAVSEVTVLYISG